MSWYVFFWSNKLNLAKNMFHILKETIDINKTKKNTTSTKKRAGQCNHIEA